MSGAAVAIAASVNPGDRRVSGAFGRERTVGMDTGMLMLAVLAALSTTQSVAIVAAAWVVVFAVVAIHQVVHRRRESRKQAERLDMLSARRAEEQRAARRDAGVPGGAPGGEQR